MSSLNRAVTILIIDDHVALAQGFAQALTGAGYRALVAHTADVALREAQLHQPEAIILDFQMPFINGVGFLYRLRADEGLRRTPVLVITGQTLTDEVRAELRGLGAHVRVKPLGLADLLTEARTLVQRGHDEGASDSPKGLPRI
jgi:adenylate cyclase